MARAQIHALRQIFADDLQGRADDGVVAGGPGCLLLRLQGLQVRNGLLGGRKAFNDRSHGGSLWEFGVATLRSRRLIGAHMVCNLDPITMQIAREAE